MVAALRTQEEPEDVEGWVVARGPALTRFAYLGCPEATARSHVHPALAALRGRLSQGDAP